VDDLVIGRGAVSHCKFTGSGAAHKAWPNPQWVAAGATLGVIECLRHVSRLSVNMPWHDSATIIYQLM